MKTDMSKDILQNIASESINNVNLKTKQANCMSDGVVTENTEILKEISDIKKSSFKGLTIEHFPLGITSHWDQSGPNPVPIRDQSGINPT